MTAVRFNVKKGFSKMRVWRETLKLSILHTKQAVGEKTSTLALLLLFIAYYSTAPSCAFVIKDRFPFPLPSWLWEIANKGTDHAKPRTHGESHTLQVFPLKPTPARRPMQMMPQLSACARTSTTVRSKYLPVSARTIFKVIELANDLFSWKLNKGNPLRSRARSLSMPPPSWVLEGKSKGEGARWPFMFPHPNVPQGQEINIVLYTEECRHNADTLLAPKSPASGGTTGKRISAPPRVALSARWSVLREWTEIQLFHFLPCTDACA